MKLGEKKSLRVISIRWGILLMGLSLIGGFSVARYNREVRALSPEQIIAQQPQGIVRVMGRVKAKTLDKQLDGGAFEMEGESGSLLQIRYIGAGDENLRELKMIVIEGEWDPRTLEVQVKQFHLPPHYGFILAAYLSALIPLCLFLLNMERNVILLSLRIKEAKPYEPIRTEERTEA